MTKLAEKIIVALDVSSKNDALRLVEQLRNEISFFKIGLQLYTAEGPEIVRAVRDAGVNVFLDLKLHDIPNTVAGAVGSAAMLDVQMLTIHLSGGPEMVRAAVQASSKSVTLLGVTVLTSTTEETLRGTGVSGSIADQVMRLAKLGIENGVNAFVASAREIQMLRAEFGHQIKIIVPGVRPAGSDAADQKRIMTPRDAFTAGADYLVIGRPITSDPSPRDAAARIISEL